ncbi:GntR family transcriptional regulator [Nocardia carnea]|uniref:GntR family transcriptional regulator n=1 Tax=Nocardia carnea TaxID=37328 RepID=UPI00245785E2|nr:GntR family transcriptional regulator [Nocardia carnea]
MPDQTNEDPVVLSFDDIQLDPLANRTQRAEAVIRRAILAGRLRPGRQLIEVDIAEQLGTSKTPVREALKSLAGSGLITISAYRGAAVRVIDAHTAAAVYDMRALLEPEAAKRTVASGVPMHDTTEILNRAIAAGETGDVARMSLCNREFHQQLYSRCGNPIMVRTLDDLRDQTALVSVASWRSTGGNWRVEADEHQAIAEAALRGDATGTAKLLREHICGFITRVLPSLTEAP